VQHIAPLCALRALVRRQVSPRAPAQLTHQAHISLRTFASSCQTTTAVWTCRACALQSRRCRRRTTRSSSPQNEHSSGATRSCKVLGGDGGACTGYQEGTTARDAQFYCTCPQGMEPAWEPSWATALAEARSSVAGRATAPAFPACARQARGSGARQHAAREGERKDTRRSNGCGLVLVAAGMLLRSFMELAAE
jgi:hypothetical protein